jgi:chromosomal replication initiation ATPase DnaA
MDTVQLGKALVPRNRLSEFTGKKKTMAQVEEEMRPPPTEQEQMSKRIKALEEQVAALRRLIILSRPSKSAVQAKRLQMREMQEKQMERIERIFFRFYSPAITMHELMTTKRTKAVTDARMVLVSVIKKAEPAISESAIGVRYGKDQAGIYALLRRMEFATPSQKRNCEEIVKVYLAGKESDHDQFGQ